MTKSQPNSREHAEFHNCYSVNRVKNDVKFLNMIYDNKTGLSTTGVTKGFIENLKKIGKDIYFFLSDTDVNISPQYYIKHKYDFITQKIPDANPHLFFLAWNGLMINDSFKKVLRKKFDLSPFNDIMCPKTIPAIGSTLTRYRTKSVLADDMAVDSEAKRRTVGRKLDDGSGLSMTEKIVWLPNGKALPIFSQAYVPLNQTHVILIRHGKSFHESGGSNPVFVGSGYWDQWKNNRRVSRAVGNYLQEAGIATAKELGKDFNVVVDTLEKQGLSLWSWSKEVPISVFGSESENTEQTARYFLQESGYHNISFNPIYGLNSQKYGALTHKFKKDIFAKTLEIYGNDMSGTDDEKKATIKKAFKNRFFHYPEGETLIEADWRIAYSFVDMLRSNQGKRILLADHSGAIRVFKAIIKTLDFADYASQKEAQDSILAMCYQPGKNVRYDYIQRKDFLLRPKNKEEVVKSKVEKK
jgi:broad specificity phosphatase PhoE